MTETLTIIFLSYLLLLLLQIAIWPLVAFVVGAKLPDSGWSITRVVGWVIVGLIIWFLAHLGLPVNTTPVIYTLVLALAAASAYFITRQPQVISSHFKRSLPFIITAETLFFIGLLTLSLIRSFNPAILDLEKFMDAGFMITYTKSATLPAPDMWLAGETINYYSFGHFLGSVMSRFLAQPVTIAYNLILGVILGFALSLSFSLVLMLSTGVKKIATIPALIAGIVGALFVGIGGNTHTIWFFLKNGTWQGYWYADATRFIENTIHEFPSYSFVVSDLHAHVWGLPLVLTGLTIFYLWLKSLVNLKSTNYYYYAGVVGLAMGIYFMTSAWDFMIYGLFLVVIGALFTLKIPALFPRFLISALIAGIVSVLTALPWLIHFDSISEGIALATEQSPFWQLVVLWTGHITVSGIATFYATKKLAGHKKIKQSIRSLFVVALFITALLLLALPEVMYVKDIYTGHPRANTMFKLTYQAFILMGLAGGYAFYQVQTALKSSLLTRSLTGTVIGLILVSTLTFPYFSYRDYYGGLRDFKGLNGLAWLEAEAPDDYAALNWLNQNVSGQPHILEAWGESYTTFNRFSAFTGFPTVIGWRVHEWLWRGGFDIPGQRSGEVDQIYRFPLSAESLTYLNQYQVEYIIVGQKERELYPDMNLQDLLQLGPTIFKQNDTTIIKYTPTNTSYLN
jgi:uncharacterized membrane protein